MNAGREQPDAFKDWSNKWPVWREGCSISPLKCSLLKQHVETGWSNFTAKQDSSSSSATAFFSVLQNAKLIFIKEVQLFILFFFLFCFWISTGFDCLNQIHSVSRKEKGATVLCKSVEQLSKKIVWYFSLLMLHCWIVGVFNLEKQKDLKRF